MVEVFCDGWWIEVEGARGGRAGGFSLRVNTNKRTSSYFKYRVKVLAVGVVI